MDIANQLQKIGLLFAHNRFIPILKEVPRAMIFPIVPDRVTGQQATHEFGYSRGTTQYQEVNMGVHQCPGKDSGFRVFGDLRKAREEVLAVLIRPKDGLPFGSPDHYVVKGSRGIQSGLTWHEILLPHLSTFVKCKDSTTSPSP